MSASVFRFDLPIVSALFALALGACAHTPAPPPGPAASGAAAVDDARLQGAGQDSSNWLSHGRTYDEQRFSPLNQINAANVNTLGLAWAYDLDTNRGQEATPLVIDGVMYSTSAWSKVQAIDAASGKLLWQYDPKVPGEVGVKACCDVVNRGVAAYKGRLYLGALDGRLIALDAKTGNEVWSVVTVDQSKSYTITGAPRVIHGKVLIGNGGAEFGVRGYISAYDADSGKLAWRWYTVPGDPSQPFENAEMQKAASTWAGEWWKLGGGGTVWDSMAYDPQLNLLYVGTGNGSPWNRHYRSDNKGDNLYLSSIVALNPDTGAYVWHYQTTPGDSWDYTATQHIIVAEVPIDGQPRKVVMQAPKNGFFYVLDAKDGKLLSAKPFATLNWATGVDPATGRPQMNPDAWYGETGKVWNAMPSPYGAHNWQPMSYSPDTKLVYIPAQDTPFAYKDPGQFAPMLRGFNVGIDPLAYSMPQVPEIKAAIRATVRGYLKAYDPAQQKEVWSVEQPGAWNGGVLSTAGSLVFEGNASGMFNAYNATTGAQVWSFAAQGGIIAAPISYAIGGQQYVAVVVGWGGTYPLSAGESSKANPSYNKSRILAFRLGATAQLPPPPQAPAPPAPPARFGDAKVLETGRLVFNGYCGVCHGDAAVGGGVLPDLRHSATIGDPERWKRIVLDGSLSSQGMVSFAPVLTPDLAETARAYVVGRANDEIAPPPSAAPAEAPKPPATPARDTKGKGAAAAPAAKPAAAAPAKAAAPAPAPQKQQAKPAQAPQAAPPKGTVAPKAAAPAAPAPTKP